MTPPAWFVVYMLALLSFPVFPEVSVCGIRTWDAFSHRSPSAFIIDPITTTVHGRRRVPSLRLMSKENETGGPLERPSTQNGWL